MPTTSEHLTRRDWMVWLGFAVVLAVAPLLWRSSFAQTMLSQIGIAIIACLAYNMLLGQGGMLSFGHAVYSGLGSFIASLLIGLLQTLPLTVDSSLADLINTLGGGVTDKSAWWPILRITLAQAAPILPYLLLVLILILRPRGLLGTREG